MPPPQGLEVPPAKSCEYDLDSSLRLLKRNQLPAHDRLEPDDSLFTPGELVVILPFHADQVRQVRDHRKKIGVANFVRRLRRVHGQLRLWKQSGLVQIQNALAALDREVLILHLEDGLLLRSPVVLLGLTEPRIRFFERIALLAGVIDGDLQI